MSKLINWFFWYESIVSFIFGVIIVVWPQLFGRLLLGQPLDTSGVWMAQLYGAMVVAWGSIFLLYWRSNQWAMFRGFALSTLPGSVLTIIVLTVILVQTPLNWFSLSYQVMTCLGMVFRLTCLRNPAYSGLKV